MSDKNTRISESISITRQKRQSQQCKVFRFKVDRSGLSKKQTEYLRTVFIEAKRCYNYILSTGDVTNFDYKELSDIVYLDKDRNSVPYKVTCLSAAMRQGLVSQIQNQIKTLSRLKRKGYTVGSLKYKSDFRTIDLKQYGVTHKITGNRIKIQGLKKPLRVNGLKQLSKYSSIDYANAKLVFDGYDYFVLLTCFTDKEEHIDKQLVGIDLGCRTTVTVSDGQKFDVQVGESERLKKLQAKLARQVKRSNNWNKTVSLIRKEYRHICNQKKDLADKILSRLKQYTVVMQDEQLDGWKSDLNSVKIQHSALGRIKSVLVSRPDTVVLDKWLPTTKSCYRCGCKNQSITLGDRVFRCPECGLEEDRDVHAAKNMLFFYNGYKDGLGTSRTSKPETGNFPGQEDAMPSGSH